MTMIVRLSFSILLAAVSALSLAQDRPEPVATFEIDPTAVTPEIDVREYDNRRVEEYRVGSQLYKMKITPRNGQPYYLVDPEGTGEMEWRRNSMDVEADVRVPQWTLFKF